MNKFTAMIFEEGGCYVAECPELGTVSIGNTKEEALESLREATSHYLGEFSERKRSSPTITSFEVTAS
ncbi:putative RNase H-like HicB family nuclease [Methanomicrobium sp. W14]|uniref:type II toxin-antitoxin system HicB family antitoxin n=1 Tax=Methanomicrobium sp. W14 TaxID=2817839 RepID=UPI001AE9229C|nr:type II toxin-antitoxin system HicB family antitoxin [Methanomicrobium sp. W14]MBP2134123.1 putative RNase H-like HicB family nuclease [Methanomicrobium sp. W14]